MTISDHYINNFKTPTNNQQLFSVLGSKAESDLHLSHPHVREFLHHISVRKSSFINNIFVYGVVFIYRQICVRYTTYELLKTSFLQAYNKFPALLPRLPIATSSGPVD